MSVVLCPVTFCTSSSGTPAVRANLRDEATKSVKQNTIFVYCGKLVCDANYNHEKRIVQLRGSAEAL